MSERDQRVYAAVCKIPFGRVATYGQIAEYAGLGKMARQVGYVLYDVPIDSKIPWHRVINARGEISVRTEFGAELGQRRLLELEGVSFDKAGRIPLKLYGWNPESTENAPKIDNLW